MLFMITGARRRFRRQTRADVEAVILDEHVSLQKEPILLFTEENDTDRTATYCRFALYLLDTGKSTDSGVDVAVATTRFIPEVEWQSGIVTTPSKLWNEFISSLVGRDDRRNASLHTKALY
jgi:hypothetical protein